MPGSFVALVDILVVPVLGNLLQQRRSRTVVCNFDGVLEVILVAGLKEELVVGGASIHGVSLYCLEAVANHLLPLYIGGLLLSNY